MEFWEIALGVSGGMIGVFGLSWTVFSGMLNSTKEDLKGKIKMMDESILDHATRINSIREDLKDKPAYDHLELHYHRKDITDLHFKNICTRFDSLEEKIDDLAKFVKNGYGK